MNYVLKKVYKDALVDAKKDLRAADIILLNRTKEYNSAAGSFILAQKRVEDLKELILVLEGELSE